MHLRNNLKVARKKRSLKQQAVANQLDTTVGTISNWENDVSSPNFNQLIILSKIYGVSIDKLLTSDLSDPDNWDENDEYSKVDLSKSNILVPSIAQAGYINTWSQIRTDENIRVIEIPGIKGEARTFEVVGDSMAPVLVHGDYVSCTKVADLRDLVDGNIYVIVSATEGVTIKYLQLYNTGIKCIPHDRSNFTPFMIEYSDVKEVWMVRIRITKYFISTHLLNPAL
ncbi:MAG: LexA family transcriptional regulator [Bacteroidota bacterium]